MRGSRRWGCSGPCQPWLRAVLTRALHTHVLPTCLLKVVILGPVMSAGTTSGGGQSFGLCKPAKSDSGQVFTSPMLNPTVSVEC